MQVRRRYSRVLKTTNFRFFRSPLPPPSVKFRQKALAFCTFSRTEVRLAAYVGGYLWHSGRKEMPTFSCMLRRWTTHHPRRRQGNRELSCWCKADNVQKPGPKRSIEIYFDSSGRVNLRCTHTHTVWNQSWLSPRTNIAVLAQFSSAFSLRHLLPVRLLVRM